MTTEIETLRAKVKKAAKRNAELHAELEKWVSAAEKAGEPKRGEWIKDEEKSRKHVEAIYTCSACHNFYAWGVTELYPYCPNCGAKMEAQDESISKFADGEWWKEAQK